MPSSTSWRSRTTTPSTRPTSSATSTSTPEIELVTVVHSETPSGTLCDVSAIGPIARARGALTLVDCVSSLGGIASETDAWQLDVCVAGAAEMPWRAARHVADDGQRRRLGADPARTRPRRAPRSSRCSTGRSSGSTASSSRSRPPSRSPRRRGVAATSCSRKASRRPSRGTALRPRPAVPASARWGSSCGRAATRSPPPA